MSWAIRLEHVTKRYRGGGPRPLTVREALTSFGHRVFDVFRGAPEQVKGTLALDDVSFEVEEGDAFALIGPNGAGKSTLLKLLTGISPPTSGRLRLRGRVGALLEVGSGLHPELTGRDNIWLYGRIIGMSKREIRRRFDQIVEFAEVRAALDTPVKMYSTGMQLRLGFSIASHVNPDIFVVDEALAVGDARFQMKCIERMSTFVANGGTLLFVSHDLPAVEALCPHSVFLLDGRIEFAGQTRDTVRAYLDWVDRRQRETRAVADVIEGRGLRLERVTLHDTLGRERYVFNLDEAIEVRLHVVAEQEIHCPRFTLGVNDGRPGMLIQCSMTEPQRADPLLEGHHIVRCQLAPLPLAPRAYELWVGAKGSIGGDCLDWSCIGTFRIAQPAGQDGDGWSLAAGQGGSLRIKHQWAVEPSRNHDLVEISPHSRRRQ